MYGSILTTATLNASLISETSQKFNRLFETSSCLSATASKQTKQNVVIATHQDSITFHYSPLTTLNKNLRTSPETTLRLMSGVYWSKNNVGEIHMQWNPVNTDTKRTCHSVRIMRVPNYSIPYQLSKFHMFFSVNVINMASPSLLFIYIKFT